jgi:drug/metabolite transporter (DMT)-like permease
MLYLILSIICSVTVGIIFKTSKQYDVHITQVVAWNYVFAVILCYLFFSPALDGVTTAAPWPIYITLAILMPSIFVFLAASIKHMGIVKTDAAQRLSLFIPILAAWFIFNEEFDTLKVTGLAIGFPAIILILLKKDSDTNNKWQYPAIVLIGFGIVDVLFKQIALYKDMPYTTSLFIIFCCAMLIAASVAVCDALAKRKKFNIINLAFGALIGIFNFGNILFYIEAHKAFASNPSTVFASMNMGVIILGSFAGILLFKEKLSLYNYIGIFMALIAIVFITLSQMKVY